LYDADDHFLNSTIIYDDLKIDEDYDVIGKWKIVEEFKKEYTEINAW
jgi:hypothetical protein